MFKKYVSACILLQLLVLSVSVHTSSAQPVAARDSVKVIRRGFIPKDKIFELVYVPMLLPVISPAGFIPAPGMYWYILRALLRGD